MVESETKAPELGRIVFGVTIGVSVAVAFFTFMKNYGKLILTIVFLRCAQ